MAARVTVVLCLLLSLPVDAATIAGKVTSAGGEPPGARSAPYSLGVNPVTQEIWLNENLTHRVYRFIPEEERFVSYPVPLTNTCSRDVAFGARGEVCLSNNPVPIAALEGGVAEIICIDINGG